MREVETYGGRVGGVWERWRCAEERCNVGGKRCVRGVEVCERGGGV